MLLTEMSTQDRRGFGQGTRNTFAALPEKHDRRYGESQSAKSLSLRRAGFEPATVGLEIRCSIRAELPALKTPSDIVRRDSLKFTGPKSRVGTILPIGINRETRR